MLGGGGLSVIYIYIHTHTFMIKARLTDVIKKKKSTSKRGKVETERVLHYLNASVPLRLKNYIGKQREG